MKEQVRLTMQRKPHYGAEPNLRTINHRPARPPQTRALYKQFDATHPTTPPSLPARELSSVSQWIIAGAGALALGVLVGSFVIARRSRTVFA